jgi:AraC family transcriptional regulator
MRVRRQPVSNSEMITENVLRKYIPQRGMAYLKCRGSWQQLPEMLAKLEEWMAGRSLAASGPPSGVYYNTTEEGEMEDLEWEVFLPVTKLPIGRVRSEGEFGIRTMPAAKVAFLYHEGTRRTAGSTYTLLREWIMENGMEIAGPAEEVYLTDFGIRESDQLTEIRVPVRSV